MITLSLSHSRTLTLLLLLTTVSAGSAAAQEFSLGTDLVNRYVWRGFVLSETASLQPYLEFGYEGLAVGAWSSYAIMVDGADELDLYASYTFDLGADDGSLSIGVTDYAFPNATADYFEFGEEGQHVIEPFISYDGVVSLLFAVNAANEADNGMYAEVGVPFQVDGVSLGLTLGALLNESAYYGVDKAGIVNLGFSASRAIAITETFTLPVFASYILNPHPDVKSGYLVFGISLAP